MCLTVSSKSWGQVDTTLLFERVNQLNDVESHMEFWEEIYRADQKHRGEQTVDSVDIANLILCSYYINKFGFPPKRLFGAKSKIITLVWIHNRFPGLDKLTFPIILSGFSAGEISEVDLRGYYLRTMYMRQFDDQGYLDKALKVIFKELALNISSKINVEEVLSEFNNCLDFEHGRKFIIGKWKEEDVYTVYHFDNDSIVNQVRQPVVTIFKSEDEKFYLNYGYSDHSHFPQELVPLHGMKNAFKFKNVTTNSYFEIRNNDLIYFDDDKQVRKVFKKYGP